MPSSFFFMSKRGPAPPCGVDCGLCDIRGRGQSPAPTVSIPSWCEGVGTGIARPQNRAQTQNGRPMVVPTTTPFLISYPSFFILVNPQQGIPIRRPFDFCPKTAEKRPF